MYFLIYAGMDDRNWDGVREPKGFLEEGPRWVVELGMLFGGLLLCRLLNKWQ